VTEAEARGILDRFGPFADQFADCFGRRRHVTAASEYLAGLFNDSERKSMQAMHGRLGEARSYQALQHFITHAPWDAARLWARLRTLVPERTGVLALDDTGLPKQGRHSVAVQRQYCGALGKIGNCQVAVSSALIGDLVWPLTCELYVPAAWTDDGARRAKVGLPAGLRFREKWRIALAHVRTVVASGFTLTAVVTDADYGTTAPFRRGLERLGLRYAVALRGDVKVDSGTGRLTVARFAAAIPAGTWRRVQWAVGTKGPLAARFVAQRVRLEGTPGERWLLCERVRTTDERKYYLLNLDATATLRTLVRLARCRWPIEQQYRELKDDLGWDHFEGRTWRGWTHHTVLTVLAFTFLQLERRRAPDRPRPTLPTVRLWLREIMGLLYVISTPRLMNMMASCQRNPPLRR
jgi:SRSO17 transposase